MVDLSKASREELSLAKWVIEEDHPRAFITTRCVVKDRGDGKVCVYEFDSGGLEEGQVTTASVTIGPLVWEAPVEDVKEEIEQRGLD